MDSRFEKSFEDFEKSFVSRMKEHEDKLKKALTGTTPEHSDIATLSRDFNDFKTFTVQTLQHFRAQLQLLSLGLDRHETFMRRKILLLHGIPEKPNEKLPNVVVDILTNQMKLSDVGINNFEACHRLGSASGKPRPVLIRFYDMEHRHLLWDHKTALRGTGFTVSEFLTKVRHRVFTKARQHFSVKSVWSTEGKIIVLTPDQKRQKIETLDELNALIVQFPANLTDAGAPANSNVCGSASQTSKAGLSRSKRRR